MLGAARLVIVALLGLTVGGLVALPDLLRGDDPIASLGAIELRPRAEQTDELTQNPRRSPRHDRRSRDRPMTTPAEGAIAPDAPVAPVPAPTLAAPVPASEGEGDNGGGGDPVRGDDESEPDPKPAPEPSPAAPPAPPVPAPPSTDDDGEDDGDDELDDDDTDD